MENLPDMPDFVGFQTIEILDPYGMTFDAVDGSDRALRILFKSGSSYCDMNIVGAASPISYKKQGQEPEKNNFYFLHDVRFETACRVLRKTRINY